MRKLIPLFLAFTIGAMTAHIHDQRAMTDLAVEKECAYHEGYNEGWRDQETLTIDRENANVMPGWICNGDDCKRIEEDQPGWDCKTMGNRKCGPQ